LHYSSVVYWKLLAISDCSTVRWRDRFIVLQEFNFQLSDPPVQYADSDTCALCWNILRVLYRAVFLNRRAAVRYRALATIIPGRERPEETAIFYKISLFNLIDK